MVVSILHLDDERSILELTKIYLEGYNDPKFKVDSVLTPNRFFFKVFYGAYDVLLIDYIMYPLNGLEVITKVRDKGVETPIILLTGRFKDVQISDKLFTNHGIKYVQKDIDFDYLVAKVVNTIKTFNDIVINSLV